MNDQDHRDEANPAAEDSPERDALIEQATAEPSDRLRQELQQANERALRNLAELENFRKRSRREMEDERRYANLPLLRDLLGVVDNVGRAIEAAEKTAEAASLLEGFKMVAQQLASVLSRYQCQRIDALGQPFDPNRHEAISQRADAEHPPNTVVDVVEDGYQLHDRVVRPAKVIVSVPPPAQ
ncbi:MAG: nucleotide exchange factor GrpE [Pirellulales bacterium]